MRRVTMTHNQVCHYRCVKCHQRPGGQVVKKIKLKSHFEISVSQKEKQIKPVLIAGIAGLYVKASCEQLIGGWWSEYSFRSQNPHCAYSNVAGVWHFFKRRALWRRVTKG